MGEVRWAHHVRRSGRHIMWGSQVGTSCEEVRWAHHVGEVRWAHHVRRSGRHIMWGRSGGHIM